MSRRRHADNFPEVAPVLFAPTRDHCKLVLADSLAEECLFALGFERIDITEPDTLGSRGSLMRAPTGFVVDEHGFGRNTASAIAP